MGIIHRGLYHFSQWYCSWFNVPFDHHIIQLPFGLVMKWTDRTSVEEVVSMQMVEAAGIPVPKVLSCGGHPNELPGISLENTDDPLDVDAEEPWLEELKTCVCSMRSWCPPIPDHVMGPFTNHQGLYKHLTYPASMHGRTAFSLNDDGHLSGLLDWESAGWYPEYWEFTTAMRFGRRSWWFQVASWMGGDQYLSELESDVALNLLTVDSYIAF
ncbi:hypothetical protein BO70DRAFT_373789 [Aspergillus heteromorphus CBS 117.55]|uniref:Aminoglycoside phosphotransferase domain-containing protein n=1 Tax=Aspergillus heteromorphus CBS 117.55 TaxID=1448321 RepID=A0A317VDC9_9EURO|nr:uncharacterized protein BO70DRAFT_373789 [Aspergillus heteromorphus CBS 117.55]PWY71017.1 hypothetical protein BO70DRAFT_373789 [Aspergillus heteromorphus CBS 117.55]